MCAVRLESCLFEHCGHFQKESFVIKVIDKFYCNCNFGNICTIFYVNKHCEHLLKLSVCIKGKNNTIINHNQPKFKV